MLCMLLLLPLIVRAQDVVWPQFRGPESNPVGKHARLADRWSKTENIEWFKEIPGRGWSSPIVTGGKVYLTTVTTEGKSKPPQIGTEYSNEYAAELEKQGLSMKEIIERLTERDIELPTAALLAQIERVGIHIDVAHFKKLIGQTAKLEFKEQDATGQWIPATGQLNGEVVALTGAYLSGVIGGRALYAIFGQLLVDCLEQQRNQRIISHDADKLETSPSPKLGQHNGEIYGGWLGLSAAEIAALENDGVI